MKKITLILGLTLFTFILSNAQVFDQDYESLNIDDPGALAGHQMQEGSSTVQIATASGNTSKILKVVHTAGGTADMWVKTSSFAVTEGEVYNVSFDIALTNQVHIVTIQYSIDDTSNFMAIAPDSPATSTNGTQSGANGRIQGATPNVFGTTTATFTVPSGFNTARVQIYQFGDTNSFELDNFLVTSPTASIADLLKFNFKSSPNPTRDYINLSASNAIDKVEIFSLLGQQVMKSDINDRQSRLDVSTLARGIYILKAYIEDASGSYKFIKE